MSTETANWAMYRPVLDISPDDELAQDLYPIFVALVDWCRKAGKTETNSTLAAVSALRSIGVRDDVVVLIRRRYAAGSRATADLHREGKLT